MPLKLLLFSAIKGSENYGPCLLYSVSVTKYLYFLIPK